ncbi:protein LDOC1-like [Ambystoma mexicanum]|uniref:protein LDOC1-like n=1 Tax=Ambystoma mexicanum TaxID=8296 RepID=UPI0037E97DF3
MATPEQVQELVAADQNLSLEMQTIKAENALLKQMVTAREPPSTDLPPMALSLGKFEGSPKKLREFLDACKVYFTFRSRTFASDHAKVGFMISNISGNALAWATPLVTGADPVLQDYGAFLDLLKSVALLQDGDEKNHPHVFRKNAYPGRGLVRILDEE